MSENIIIFSEKTVMETQSEVSILRNRLIFLTVLQSLALLLLIGWGVHREVNALYFGPDSSTQETRDAIGLVLMMGIAGGTGITVGTLGIIFFAWRTAKAIVEDVRTFVRGAGHVHGTSYDVYAKSKKEGYSFPFIRTMADQWERWWA